MAAVLLYLPVEGSQLFQLPTLPDPLGTTPSPALPVMLQPHVLVWTWLADQNVVCGRG